MKNVLLIIFLFSGICSFSQRVFNDEQIKTYLPKKEPKYKLAKSTFNLVDTSIISTDAFYIRTSRSEIYEDKYYYIFLRFFEDGRVFFSFSYLSIPNQKEFNDFSYGKFGRYIIQKDNIITIELYQDKYTGIEFLHAKKTENGIQFFSHGSRNPKCILNKRDTAGGNYEKRYF